MESSNIFRLWDKEKMSNVCLTAATSVHQKCDDSQDCNPSAILMAQLYTEFVEFVNIEYGNLYKSYDRELNHDLEEES
jgi:hypothetical protein